MCKNGNLHVSVSSKSVVRREEKEKEDSLEQGLVRSVRRPGRTRSRMSRDDGKPNAVSGTHRNPSIH